VVSSQLVKGYVMQQRVCCAAACILLLWCLL